MKWDNPTILKEVQYADQFIKNALASLPQRVADYVGKYYGNAPTTSDTNVVNHSLDYVSLVLPQLVHDVPEVGVESALGGPPELVAEVQRAGITRWTKDANFVAKMEMTMLDALFGHCVTLITQRASTNERLLRLLDKKQKAAERDTEDLKRFQEDDGGVGSMQADFGGTEPSKPMWPDAVRLNPAMFGFDPACDEFYKARFAYHKFTRPKSEIEALAAAGIGGWNKKVVTGAKTISGIPSAMRDSSPREIPDRDDLLLCEVWVREHKFSEEHTPDEGFHGTIFTLLLTGIDEEPSLDFVREPRPFYGPREGPYVLEGVYPVPGNPLRLAPLVAVEQQVRDLNALEKANTASAMNYKRVVGVNAADYSDAKRLGKAMHDWILPLQNLDQGKVQEFEIGGITEPMLVHAQVHRERLDRASGITEAKRGNVTGAATASENVIADEASDTRFGYIAHVSERVAQAILYRIGWYLYHDDRVIFPISASDFTPVEGVEELKGVEMWFKGGSHDRDEGYTYDDLELTIVTGSMQKKNVVRKRMEFNELLMTTANLLPLVQATASWVKWSGIFTKLGKQYDQNGWERMFDFQAAGQMIPVDGPQPKAQGQVGKPQQKPTINISAGGGRGGSAKPPAPKAAGAK